MSRINELYAPSRMAGKVPTIAEQDAMAKELGATSLFYLPVDAIARCIGLPEDQLCRGCITGEYPTAAGRQMYELALINRDNGTEAGRTYECSPSRKDAKPLVVR